MVVNDKVSSFNVLTAIYFFSGICTDDIPKNVHILTFGIRFSIIRNQKCQNLFIWLEMFIGYNRKDANIIFWAVYGKLVIFGQFFRRLR